MDMAQLTKEELVEIAAEQSEKIALLEQRLSLLLAKKFGSKSEKVSADQLALFIGADEDELPSSEEDEEEYLTITYERKARGKRKKCDENLERVRKDYELPLNQRQCGCGGVLEKIDEQISEQYEIVPARYVVIQHVQHKYACQCCKKNIQLAPKPAQPINKANAGPGLLAHVATTKFVDAVPLHRQEKQHERYGVIIPRNTMARWLILLSDLVIPLINLMEDAIRAGPYIQCDETPLQVLKELGRKASSLSYMWVRRGGKPGRMVVLFRYYPTRAASAAIELLDGYTGFVQCDGYSGYLPLEKRGMTLVGCFAHVHRKYSDALKSLPSKEVAQKSKAAMGIKFIKRLYKIEAQCKTLNAEKRYQARQDRARPILREFKDWLDEQLPRVLPKSSIGKAIRYTLNQWDKLIRYCDDGRLEIDNNSDERAIRPMAVGRRNWLFCDTPKGAHTNARFYSLIETCKLHGHEPYAYLRHIFKELPLAKSVDEYEALLPWNLDVETIKQQAREV